METDRFDAVTACLAQGLTRRRGLSLLAALGASTALAADDVAGKRKKKRGKKKPQPQPCGGACGACQACFNGACVQVADAVACGNNGACFAGKCVTCPAGKVPVAGLCARPCTTRNDCVDGGNCRPLEADTDTNVYDTRSFCVLQDGDGTTMDSCPHGHESECPAGNLCVKIFNARCAPPA